MGCLAVAKKKYQKETKLFTKCYICKKKISYD